MKENQQVQPVIDTAAMQVRMVIADGGEPIVMDMSKLHPDIIRHAAYVGMAQVRLNDAAAIPRTRKDGSIIPDAERLAMKRARIQALVDHYHSGTAEWAQGRSGEGARVLTIEAIARVRGIDYEQAEADVEAMAEKRGVERKDLLAHLATSAKVAEAMLAIRKERMPKPKADADALLAEMGG